MINRMQGDNNENIPVVLTAKIGFSFESRTENLCIIFSVVTQHENSFHADQFPCRSQMSSRWLSSMTPCDPFIIRGPF